MLFLRYIQRATPTLGSDTKAYLSMCDCEKAPLPLSLHINSFLKFKNFDDIRKSWSFNLVTLNLCYMDI